MQVGDYITGKDRSYNRTIYVIVEIINDGMQARCWARYYDGFFFYRNDKHNFALAKLWLNEYKPLGRNDYPETVLAKAQFLTDDDETPSSMLATPIYRVRHERPYPVNALDIDGTILDYVIARSVHRDR